MDVEGIKFNFVGSISWDGTLVCVGGGKGFGIGWDGKLQFL